MFYKINVYLWHKMFFICFKYALKMTFMDNALFLIIFHIYIIIFSNNLNINENNLK